MIMLKILQARLQQYVYRELADGFIKGTVTRDQIANIHWIIEKAREFQKNIYLCFIGYEKALDCVDHNKLWKILNKTGILEHLTCLLRNLYAGQEATFRTGHRTTGSKSGKEYDKAVHCQMGWMRHKLDSRLLGEISITSEMQMIPR